LSDPFFESLHKAQWIYDNLEPEDLEDEVEEEDEEE
jgi:hypothetical protein